MGTVGPWSRSPPPESASGATSSGSSTAVSVCRTSPGPRPGSSAGRCRSTGRACSPSIPPTLLPTGEFVENGLPADGDGPAHRDRAAGTRLQQVHRAGRGPRPGGEPERGHRAATSTGSLRQRELRRPSGFEDELRAVLADASGTWGALTLLREAKRPHFTPAEVRFVASLAGVARRRPPAGRAARRRRRRTTTTTPGSSCWRADDTVEMANRAADRWLDELDAGVTRRAHRSSSPSVAADPAPAIGRRRLVRRAWPGPGSAPAPGAGSSCAVRSSATATDRPGRGLAGGGPPAGAGPADRRRLRLHRTRAAGHRARGAGASRRARSPTGCICPPTRCRTT